MADPTALAHPRPGPVPGPEADLTAAGGDVLGEVREHLAGLDDRPLDEHLPAYDGVHRLLQGALSRLDEG